jgi:ATP-dependent RNA helicase DeaD
MNKAQKGYKRLFINLGKKDGFFPGVLMQTLNRYVGGRQEVGHIDLLDTISYFEVPEKDARKVMTQLTGIRYKGRTVRCNSEDERDATPASNKGNKGGKGRKKDDWRSLMNPSRVDFKGEVPDFSEEGWARRKTKKK